MKEIPNHLDCIHRGSIVGQRDAQCAGTVQIYRCEHPELGGETILRKIACDHAQRSCQACKSLERRDGLPSLQAQLTAAQPLPHDRPAAVISPERQARRDLVTAGKLIPVRASREKMLSRQKAVRPLAPAIRWISAAQMTRDVPKLIAQLPPDLAGIAGVVRSGMGPAWQLAAMLHLPLYEFRQQTAEVRPLGHGYRGTIKRPGKLLIIDDTIAGGRTMRQAQQKFRGEAIWACIYTVQASLAEQLGALYVEETGAHFLEWNVFNNGPLRRCGVDFDGILCYDPTVPDADEAGYAAWLAAAAPRWTARKLPIPLIVTARLEKHRAATEAWLKRWGMAWEALEMYPAEDFRQRKDVAAWKASVLERYPQVTVFIESSNGLAERIAERWQGRVICPDAEAVY